MTQKNPALSLQAKILKRFTRNTVRPLLNPNVPLSLQRRGLELMGRSMLKPRGLHRQSIELGTIPTALVQAKKRHVTAAEHAILYCHGGAYIIGSPQVYASLTGQICRSTQLPVYAVDYRLAPEYPFPAALDDVTTVYQRLRQDHKNITVMGDSAGGGLALALALSLREDGEQLPDNLVLFSPLTDLQCNSPTYAQHAATDATLTQEWLLWAGQYYRGNLPDGHPLCSPLHHDMTGLPRTLIQVGSDEILLDDSQRLASRMQKAGVPVSLEVYPELWHVFQAQAAVVPEAKQALQKVAEFLASK